jgi:N-acetylglucosaminyl-diphospho-decaprenol L-rhamnosyltransferase
MTATVVIVGYRAYAELRQCLASLAAHEPDVPVVVVDHAADEARGRESTAVFPRVTYLPRRENPGFAAGVNYAARHAVPGPLLLLNPDCQIAAPVVAPLLGVLAAHPEAGVVGGLIREGDGALQHSARRFPDITTGLGGRTSWLSRVAPDNPLTRRNLKTAPAGGVVPVDWVSGAFTLIRREAFDQVRGFDERFFLYWEDADFCRRAADAGWVTLYAPVAEVVHLTARASRHAPLRSLRAFHLSAFRYYWKHGSVGARVAAPMVAAGLAGRFLLRALSARRGTDQAGDRRQ